MSWAHYDREGIAGLLAARFRGDVDLIDLLVRLDGWKIHHRQCWEFYAADRVGVMPARRDAGACIGRMTASPTTELASTNNADQDARSYWIEPHTRNAVELVVQMLGVTMGYEIVKIDAGCIGISDGDGRPLEGKVDFMLRACVGSRPLWGRRFARVYHYCNFIATPGKRGKRLELGTIERWKEIGDSFMIDEGETL